MSCMVDIRGGMEVLPVVLEALVISSDFASEIGHMISLHLE